MLSFWTWLGHRQSKMACVAITRARQTEVALIWWEYFLSVEHGLVSNTTYQPYKAPASSTLY
jgi:hypothetical protein